MKALVTGGSGFIGSNLARRLVKLGYKVSITGTTSESDTSQFEHVFPLDYKGNEHYDVVFHQAANNDTQCMDVAAMNQANVEYPMELFYNLVQHGCKKIVYASSTAVYGNGACPYKEDQPLQPLTPYAVSKAKFDEFAMEFAKSWDVSIVGLRYCNVYGPGESHKGKRASMIYQMMQNILANVPVKLFKPGDQARDWIYIQDVVRANLLALTTARSDIYNCGTGVAVSFTKLYHCIARELMYERGTKASMELIDCPFPDTFQSYTCCDIEKIREELGFIPLYTPAPSGSDSSFNGIEDYVRRELRK